MQTIIVYAHTLLTKLNSKNSNFSIDVIKLLRRTGIWLRLTELVTLSPIKPLTMAENQNQHIILCSIFNYPVATYISQLNYDETEFGKSLLLHTKT